MSTTSTAIRNEAARRAAEGTVFSILAAISASHFINDMIQSLIPAIYPILKDTYHLDFTHVGLITLTYQFTASLLQPLIGHYTDKRPKPWSLPIGMGVTLVGLAMMSRATSFPFILVSAALVGIGSAIFHPESSRVARMASGGQHGLAQSVFQVGGNLGSSLGPLLALFIVIPGGQHSILWFTIAALAGMLLLGRVSQWYRERQSFASTRRGQATAQHPELSQRRVTIALVVLMALMFSKFVYLASINSYYTFFLMQKFGVSVQRAEKQLFIFLAAVAAGTIIGGPIGDRLGRKYVIWVSILGVLPFSLILPHANLFWTGVLTVFIGLILASAFSAIVVYAQELLPGRVGMISGLFFGLAFGMAGVGAAALGRLADATSIYTVYQVCAFLPALGLLTALLPNLEGRKPQGR